MTTIILCFLMQMGLLRIYLVIRSVRRCIFTDALVLFALVVIFLGNELP